jgi:protein-disulfide isomerase
MSRIPPLLKERDHILGSETAPINFVEYGDYQCPRCCQAHQMVKAICQQLDTQICFGFRHFPLSAIHPYAQYAAEVAEAASAQAHFWQVHDYLFEHQQRLGNGQLLRYVKQLGMDIDRFEREIAEHQYTERVHQDMVSGIQGGVNGTPTFFINGDRYDGAYDYDAILAKIYAILSAL